MPDLAPYHPIAVHFAIALLVAGSVFRFVAFAPRAAFAGPAAASLILVGTAAAFLANRSGHDAHGPVERVPGSYKAVVEHEEWGDRTLYAFGVVALVEVLALVLRRRQPKAAAAATVASAVLCLPALFSLYEAGEHGGELVYSYAGGVAVHTGKPEDVGRLLVAAAHHQAQADRKAGRPEDAAAVVGEVARRFPGDPLIQMMAAESALKDKKDAASAVAILNRVGPPADDVRTTVLHGLLLADALEAAGRPDEASAVVQKLAAAYPDNARVKRRLEAKK